MGLWIFCDVSIVKPRENSWHCCAFVGSFTTQKWPSWNCLPRSPTLLGRCELLLLLFFFFVIMAMQKDLWCLNHPLYKWVHSEKATSAFWMVQIHISSRHFFKDDQLELAPTRCHVCWKLTSPASPSGGVVVGDPFLGFDGSQARCPRHPRSCGGLWPGSSRAGLSGTIL